MGLELGEGALRASCALLALLDAVGGRPSDDGFLHSRLETCVFTLDALGSVL